MRTRWILSPAWLFLPFFTIVAATNVEAADVSGNAVTVAADASDNVGVVGVQFLLDGAPLGAEDLSEPYAISWDTTTLSDGDYTLTARARDAAGNASTSAPVVVTVDNTNPDSTPPSVSTTSPADGATVAGPSVAVTADASDDVGVAGVQFLLDGAPLGVEDLTAPYGITWDTTTASPGSHTLTARARDAAGNQTTAAPVTVNVNNPEPDDVNAPTVSTTSPANGATVAGTSVTVTADASDDVGVVGVQFLLDGLPLGVEDLAAPYAISWDTTSASNGAHALSARARDAAGNQTTSSSISVTVNNAVPDTTLPTISTTSPADGATVSGAGVAVSASASDNVGVVGVQFLLDGSPLGSEDLTAPYAVSWDTTSTSDGSHTLTARARDAAGNEATSLAISVVVDNVTPDTGPPSGAMVSPTNGSSVSGPAVLVSADATDDVGVVGVQFLLDGSPLGAEDTAAPYSINWDSTTVTDGAHILTARARDAAGNQTTFTAITVDVSNQTPGTSADDDTTPASGTQATMDLRLLRLPVPGAVVIRSDSDVSGVAELELHIDGQLMAAASGNSIEYLWDTRGLLGSHQVQVVAFDSADSEVLASASIFDSMTSSQNATADLAVLPSSLGVGSVTIRAQSAVGNVQRMELYIERELIQTTSSSQLNYTWDLQSVVGTQEILVVTYDSLGVSASVSMLYR